MSFYHVRFVQVPKELDLPGLLTELEMRVEGLSLAENDWFAGRARQVQVTAERLASMGRPIRKEVIDGLSLPNPGQPPTARIAIASLEGVLDCRVSIAEIFLHSTASISAAVKDQIRVAVEALGISAEYSELDR